uniref:Putative secreted protein n=1 Tax=Ixodes ricinus TaxID=34613 RepID=A0A6B0UV67_IXORI
MRVLIAVGSSCFASGHSVSPWLLGWKWMSCCACDRLCFTRDLAPASGLRRDSSVIVPGQWPDCPQGVCNVPMQCSCWQDPTSRHVLRARVPSHARGSGRLARFDLVCERLISAQRSKPFVQGWGGRSICRSKQKLLYGLNAPLSKDVNV